MFKKLLISLVLVVPFVFGSVGITSAHATSGGSGATTIVIVQQSIPTQNPCVHDLYVTLASLGAHPHRSDVDAAVTDYIDCRGGATSFGSPFQFDFPVTRPFNFGFFPGEFNNNFPDFSSNFNGTRSLGNTCDFSGTDAFDQLGSTDTRTFGVTEFNPFGRLVCVGPTP